jgi:CRISPR system Cascade subunit CasE
MYLSKVIPTIHFIHKLKRKFSGNLFWEHQMVWDLFDNTPEQTRDFLYRREDTPGQLPFYYVVSARHPKCDGLDLDVQSKKYKPALQQGDRLQFNLRANAVVTRKVDGNSKKRLRRDIIEAKVDEYKRRYSNPKDLPRPSVIHYEAAQGWLHRQGENNGFSVSEFFVENHSFNKVKKPNDPNTRQFTSLDLHGQLIIDDPGQFTKIVENGLGRSKAFGCGLLLIKRFSL